MKTDAAVAQGLKHLIIETFFDSYREAFERGDETAIARHFGERVHIASDTGSSVRVTFASLADWRSTIQEVLAKYRALGVSRVELGFLAISDLSPRLAQASARWTLAGRAGDPLHEFRALYTLAWNGEVCRIIAIAHDELAASPQRAP